MYCPESNCIWVGAEAVVVVPPFHGLNPWQGLGIGEPPGKHCLALGNAERPGRPRG